MAVSSTVSWRTLALRRIPRPMTRSAVATARATSLTAVLCYCSCGTFPLSIFQATRLTCSSHKNAVSPAPRRPQTRSSYTGWLRWANRFGGSTEPRFTQSGMAGAWCDAVDAGNRQYRHGWPLQGLALSRDESGAGELQEFDTAIKSRARPIYV